MSTGPRHLGKYELRERLARGGQGEVWKAFDTQLRRYVAIKQLHADLQSDPDFASRFEREARFIASLHHPNIVQIHDFQLLTTPGSDSSTAYMVMDYIEGPTLADYIRDTARKGRFPGAADIVYIFTAVSLAIDYAHAQGMIHRDIKPPNIILDRRTPRRYALGTPILTDFGIAKLQGVAADKTVVLGTPLYVSPEQAQRLAGDKRSDLYSLGIILYEMTTGVTPFRGESVMAILLQHYRDLPTPPALINPHIPQALSGVILKSIAKDPEARFSSACAMTVAVAEALDVAVPAELLRPGAAPAIAGVNSRQRLSPTSTPAPPLTGQASPLAAAAGASQVNNSPPGPGTSAHQSGLSPALPPARRRGPRTALIILLIAVLAASGLLFALHSMTPPSSSSTSQSVVGQVRFLSSPHASHGSIDEVEISMTSLPDAPAGERYYAWLQVNGENILPIHWPLATQHGQLEAPSTFSSPLLLKNRPYLFLITLEKASPQPVVASFAAGARLYYAELPPIGASATFDIRQCPQGGNAGICMS
jgi:eukaryotic-like serine/threonine-protein kinase